MMHTVLRNWRASRSGPRMTITGYAATGELMKIPIVSIQGPDAGRMLWPKVTIGVKPDGTSVELA